MTDTTAADRQTLQRASLLFNADTALHWDDALAQAAALLEVERADEAARQAKAREMTDGFARMLACPACGTGNTLGNRDGLCDPCGQTATVIRLERAAAETVQGRNRRQLVETWLDRTGA
jgi:hypothetical protein